MNIIHDPENNFEQYINYLYTNLTGFIALNRSKEALETKNIHPTYGEILPASINKLIEQLNLDNDDIFYDLGSGIGKFVLNFFLKTPIKKSCGIEAIQKRHNTAKEVYEHIIKDIKLHDLLLDKFSCKKLLEFKLGNFLTENFNDATILFMNDVAYSYTTVAKLAKKINKLYDLKYLICYQKFNNFKYLTEHKVIKLQCSWYEENNPGCDFNIYSNPSLTD